MAYVQERVFKASQKKQNQSVFASQASGCCCIIDDWTIGNEERSYKLDLYKSEKRLAYNNKMRPEHAQKNEHALYIVTKPATDQGVAQNKKITVDYIFGDCAKEGCDLVMVVEDQETRLSKRLISGQPFEIDTAGDIIDPNLRSDPEEGFQPHTSKIRFANIISFFSDSKYTDRKLIVAPYGSRECGAKKAVLYVKNATTINGEISLSYSSKAVGAIRTVPSLNAISDTMQLQDKNNYLEVAGTLSLTRGLNTFVFSKSTTVLAGSQTSVVHDGDLFEGFKKKLNPLIELLSGAPSEVVLPNNNGENKEHKFEAGKTSISLKATNVKLADDPESHETTWNGELEIGVDLFNGAKGTVDVLNYAIARGNGALSNLLEKVRNKARRSVGNDHINFKGDVRLDLTISGGVSGSITLEREAKALTTTGAVTGSIMLSIEGKAEGAIKIFRVKATAGASVRAASGIKGELKAISKEEEMEYEGDLYCTGLTIYYAAYTSYEFKDSDESEADNETGNELEEHLTKSEFEAKADGKLDLVEKFSLLPDLGGEKS